MTAAGNTDGLLMWMLLLLLLPLVHVASITAIHLAFEGPGTLLQSGC